MTGAAGWWFALKGQSGASRGMLRRLDRGSIDESTPGALTTHGYARAPWAAAKVTRRDFGDIVPMSFDRQAAVSVVLIEVYTGSASTLIEDNQSPCSPCLGQFSL